MVTPRGAAAVVRGTFPGLGLALLVAGIVLAIARPDGVIVVAFLGSGIVLLGPAANPDAPMKLSIGPASAEWRERTLDAIRELTPQYVGPPAIPPEGGSGVYGPTGEEVPGTGATTAPSGPIELRELARTATSPEDFARALLTAIANERARLWSDYEAIAAMSRQHNHEMQNTGLPLDQLEK